jgi:hypothetical protein
VRRAGHREHWPLRCFDFHAWLAALYYDKTNGRVAKDSAVKDARAVLLAKANDPRVRAHTRVAGHDGAIYLDLRTTSGAPCGLTPRAGRSCPIHRCGSAVLRGSCHCQNRNAAEPENCAAS